MNPNLSIGVGMNHPPAERVAPRMEARALPQGFTLGSAVAPFQGAQCERRNGRAFSSLTARGGDLLYSISISEILFRLPILTPTRNSK